jgi:hypothetical protein
VEVFDTGKVVVVCVEGNENPKETIPNTDYDRSETIGEYGIFRLCE